jgi:DNA adenine methylase
MDDSEHADLLDALDRHPGPVVLSGYANDPYDQRLTHWERVTLPTVGEHGKHQVEVLWLNSRAGQAQQLRLESLFQTGEQVVR